MAYYNTPLRGLLVTICFLFITTGQSTTDEKYVPIHSTGTVHPGYLFWSSDSTSLYFASDEAKYEYSLPNRHLSEIEQFPFIQTLSAEEKLRFNASSDIASVSPNGDAIVYVSNFETPHTAEGINYNLFAFGSFSRDFYVPLLKSHDFRLRWSDDQSTFIVEHDTPYGGQTLFTHVVWAPYPSTRLDLRETIIGSVGVGDSIYDLSPDGRQLLYPAANLGYYDGLLLQDATLFSTYSPIEESTKLLIEADVIGAAFIPNDKNHILVVNEQGIVKYHLGTHESSIINDAINSTWATWCLFSPDNQYVAVLGNNQNMGGYYQNQLFILPVDSTK